MNEIKTNSKIFFVTIKEIQSTFLQFLLTVINKIQQRLLANKK